MQIERIESPGLAHYSYVLIDRHSATMVVVDPRRDVEEYLQRAERQQLKISAVLETHIHADYCSGAHELATLTGAPLHVSQYDAGKTYVVSFPHNDLADGDVVEAGSIRIVAKHCPGHTPEHLSFLLFDRDGKGDGTKPVCLLTGDFLFVGSLGRPDLLGDEQKRALAEQMFESVRRVLPPLPDDLPILPAHGAGSMCGSGMSGRSDTTLGFERATNPYLDLRLSQSEFVDRLLHDVPPFPPYYRRMKQVNALGPALLTGRTSPPGLSAEDVEGLLSRGAVVIDLRDQLAFGAGHIPGSFGIGLGNLLPVWAAWVVPYGTPIVLVSNEPQGEALAARMLSRVGLDDVVGYLAGGVRAWRESGRSLDSLPQITPDEAARALARDSGLAVVDVRSYAEWCSGHIEGAHHHFGGTIADHLTELPPPDSRIAITCGGGYRSTVIASVLLRLGYRNVANLTGGMGAWCSAGLPSVAATRSRQTAALK